MADPVVEQIAVKLETRVSQLTSSGYSAVFQASSVVRPLVRDLSETPADKQIVIEQSDTEIDEALSHPGNPPATAWVQTFDVYVNINPSESSTTALSTLVNLYASEIRKAVTDATNWHNWDGLAINTTFGAIEKSSPNGSFIAVKIPVVVTFRTDEDDPTVARA